VNYDLRAKFLRKFLPSLVEGSCAVWCGGASGDEGRNYIIRGESTVGYIESCSVVQTPPCDLFYSAHKSLCTFQSDLPTTKTFRTKSEVKLHIWGSNMSHCFDFINRTLCSVETPTVKVLPYLIFHNFLSLSCNKNNKVISLRIYLNIYWLS
jgi:hypothetical protein